jgi:hypothetical protein
MNQPLSIGPIISQTRPPPMNILLPKNPPKTDKVDLKFYFEVALEKMHMTIPLRKFIKVPSIKERFIFFSKVQMDQWNLLSCYK